MTNQSATRLSSASILIAAAKRATRETWPLIRSRAPLLVGLHLLGFAAEQYFRYSEEIASLRMNESLGLVATNAGLSLSFDLFWQAAFFVFAVQAITDRERSDHTPPLDAFILHFNSLAIENTRVIARVLFWLPFLFVPAVYHYARLAFVGFIVVGDPGYGLGRVSALGRSHEITRGHVGLCLFALVVSALGGPLLSNLVHGGEIAVWRNPIGAISSLPVTLAVNVWGLVFMYSIYRALSLSTRSA